ncbi:MAG: glycerol-3-phosphate acyltransferase, partial [Mailhella sp.]|nr:glycerol-3-phosphate acyltransferase [Mailhella sp.]
MSAFLFILLTAAAFLLGSIPFGLVIARTFKGIDPRKEGSGNIGSTNVARTCGLPLGL